MRRSAHRSVRECDEAVLGRSRRAIKITAPRSSRKTVDMAKWFDAQSRKASTW